MFLLFRFNVGMTDEQVKDVISTLKRILDTANVTGGLLNQFPFLRHIFPRLTGFEKYKEGQEYMNNFFTVSHLFNVELVERLSI